MRYMLLISILTITGCSGQENTKQQNKIDTVKLFNPNGHRDNADASDLNVFKRAISIGQKGYSIILNDKENEVESLREVESFISLNKEDLKSDLLYILMDSTTDFKKTLSLINVLSKNQVTNYKVINIQTYFTPPEPVTIKTPPSVISTLNETDSTNFNIIILDNGIALKLLGKETNLKNIDELDSFIGNHKSDIKKIVIISKRNVSTNFFNSILEVLKKHEYFKYNLVTKDVP